MSAGELGRQLTQYGDHKIGDGCVDSRASEMQPLTLAYAIKEAMSLLRIGPVVSRGLAQLRDFYRVNGANSDSVVEYHPGREFNPNLVSPGTILRLSEDLVVYSTTRVPIAESDRPFIECYPDKEIWKDLPLAQRATLGVVVELPKPEQGHAILNVTKPQILLTQKRPKVYILKQPVRVGEWSHGVGVKETHAIIYWNEQAFEEGTIPLEVWRRYVLINPNVPFMGARLDNRGSWIETTEQRDYFQRHTGVEILSWGKGARKDDPLETLATSSQPAAVQSEV